jgi:hypothetical protein
MFKPIPQITAVITLIITGVVLFGCGKKSNSSSLPENSPANLADSSDPVDKQLVVADAALRAGDYPAAVEALIPLRRARLDSRQAAVFGAQMQSLQRSLVAAVERGDQKAKSASDRLREAAAMR